MASLIIIVRSMLQFHNISLALRVWSNSWKWVAIGSSMNRYWKTLNSESSSITKWKSIATIISKLWLRSWSTSWKSSTQTKWSSLNWLFKRPKSTSKNDSSRFIVYIISFREFILNFNFSKYHNILLLSMIAPLNTPPTFDRNNVNNLAI